MTAPDYLGSFDAEKIGFVHYDEISEVFELNKTIKSRQMDKQQLKEREAKVIELAVAFCNEFLDEECAELCTKLVQKLGRKRSCPLQSGRIEIWAAASVYTICSINFMFSKSSRLNTSSYEIAEHFGASGSTIAQKSRVIKDLLKIRNVFDPDFSLKEIADNNPFNHLVMRNGLIFFE